MAAEEEQCVYVHEALLQVRVGGCWAQLRLERYLERNTDRGPIEHASIARSSSMRVPHGQHRMTACVHRARAQ